jgi:hypothetical protein
MQVEETLQCLPNIWIVVKNTNNFPVVSHNAEMSQSLISRGRIWRRLLFHRRNTHIWVAQAEFHLLTAASCLLLLSQWLMEGNTGRAG